MDTTKYTVNELNQYNVSGNAKFAYDKNGNMVSNGKFMFSYDYRNRLMEVKKTKDGAFVAKYSYDVLGRRITKETKETVIKYVYSNNDAISEDVYEKEDDGLMLKETKEYVYGQSIDDTIAMIRTEYDDGKAKEIKSYFYHKNQLGSTVAITDGKGKVVEEYRYDAFGKTYVRSGKSENWRELTESKIGNVRLFTGREYDGETGMYYYRARYYDVELGRFVSRDPIGILDSYNLYEYVKGNPIRYMDPTGLISKSLLGKVWEGITTINPLPIEKLEELKVKADSFAIVRTTPFDPENTDPLSMQIHTEIIFFSNNTPIASLGSAPVFWWGITEDEAEIKKYAEFWSIVGDKKDDVVGCIEGLNNSLSSSPLTINGKLTICWHGAISCYNNAKWEQWWEANIFIDQIANFILPKAY